MFAAPIPIISLSPFTWSPLRAAKADAVEIVSVNDTRPIPRVPANSTYVGQRHRRDGERGEALRQHPDHRHTHPRQVEHVHRDDRQHHGDQHPRSPRQAGL